MGIFATIKKGFSAFGNAVSELHNPTKKVSVKNDSMVEAAKVESESKKRVAQMEQENKIKLAEMETERVEAWRSAQLDIIQAQALAQMAVEKARAEGMTIVANQFADMQKKLFDLAEKRIAIIEQGSLRTVRDIEAHYEQISEKISAQRDDYNFKKVPQLLTELKKFKVGTANHTLYMTLIQNDMTLQNQFILSQIESMREQQNKVLEILMSTRDKVIAQTGQITQTIAEKALPQGSTLLPAALSSADLKQLPPAK